MDRFVIAVDDPRAADVTTLLERHLAFMNELAALADVYALDLDGLLDPAVTLFSARGDGGQLLAIGALRELDATHGEVKSMHTAEAARGHGIGRAMLGHLLDVARARGYRRVSLETGTMDALAPARSLYLSVGFTSCEAFGDYSIGPNNTCMTLLLG